MININGGNIKHVSIPPYIEGNLSHTLRAYQEEALKRFLYYYDDGEDVYNEKGEVLKKENRLLFQMATGSGKTLIMAAVMLEMYHRGYRNFWYFVTSTDIIVKTYDNFCNSASSKCCFANSITIDGRRVEVRQVESFAESDRDAINIKLGTINELHQVGINEFGGGFIKENGVTLEDFKDTPIVLLGDESHHFNAATKAEEKENVTWEDSLDVLLRANSGNRLFEFTATADLSTGSVAKKYENTLIYNYDLKRFREDRYSKDIFTFSTDDDMEAVILRAVLVSEYRAHVASDEKIFLKPVILFKSRSTNENKTNFDTFNALVNSLTGEQIEAQFALGKSDEESGIWGKTCAYFNGKESALAGEIKADFDAEKGCVLLHDGTNKRAPDQSRKIATLEEATNPVRAIFAVDMLSEGWDVLNLFDIVRLYDVRDGKWEKDGTYKAGKTTISEIQLIGRGARYYPFTYKGKTGGDNADEKYRRKFDGDLEHPLRAIEQMHYHCKHNPKYISELKSELEKSGLIEGEKRDFFTLEMNDSCEADDSPFQKKFVFVNERERKEEILKHEPERELTVLPAFDGEGMSPLQIELPTGKSSEESMFSSGKDSEGIGAEQAAKNAASGEYRLEEIASPAIIRAAINTNPHFTFHDLKAAYTSLASMEQYIDLLGKRRIIAALGDNPSQKVRLIAVRRVLQDEAARVAEEKDKMFGTRDFAPIPTKKAFKKRITRKKSSDMQYPLDFGADWCVYKAAQGTKDESAFVEWFTNNMMTPQSDGCTEMEVRGWSEVYLARNEGAVKIYNFDDGANSGKGFEPDFVLFAKRSPSSPQGRIEGRNKDYVFYIEVKGDWAYNKEKDDYSKEQWKEDFLLALESTAQLKEMGGKAGTFEIDCGKYRLVGMPFYNEKRADILQKAFLCYTKNV